jgi:hypothetical protein
MKLDADTIPKHFPPTLDPDLLGRTDEVTLAQARDYLRRVALGKGATCPCCDGFTRFYVRHLNVTQCKALVWLAVASGPDFRWVDIPQEAPKGIVRSNQYATMRHWKLVERLPKDPEQTKTKTSGIWRPTPLGRQFAYGQASVIDAVIIYKGTRMAFHGEPVHIMDVRGGFDYAQTMAEAVNGLA